MPNTFHRRSLAIITLLAVVALSACGAPTRPSSSATSTAAVAGGTVPDALNFTAPLVGGGTFDGANLAGRPVVFWFWAPT